MSKRSNGSKCPYCSNQKVGYGNDLLTKYPEVAKKWHPTKNGELHPSKVIPGSSKKVWWKCNKGHEYLSEIRVQCKSGCKECYKINRRK